ncbi:MAG: HU family DNA-binding protein [bacterium]|nr:HU family DNA-binding protein [bacterium]
MWPSTVALLAKKTGMGRAMARRVVESLGDLIAEELAADEDGSHKLRISGLGTFDTKLSAAREGRNPATGETIQIPAKKRIRFRATAPLKRRIEGS